ncbi:SRPBCC family protein [Kaistella palustris]|uniref:polyketide cyclase n=1 Tax=Kaistella palustris TaxID=493376 RepID=UPI001F3FBEE2|nr:polyketide cyclase [Kaistella palustris]
MIFIFGIYAVSMTFVPENKDFTLQKEIGYPVDKVFPQFNNLQNFSHWNAFLADDPNFVFDYFTPYEGKGSSLAYHDKKDDDVFGELFIRYDNPNRTLRYQLFEGRKSTPYLIDVKFENLGDRTRINWYIHSPKQPFLKRSVNLLSEDEFADRMEKSMKNLANVLGNKVDKDRRRESLKFDSLMVEQQQGQLLLGVNVNSRNEKNSLFKNIVMNHNKVLNYVRMDLGKKEDEYGEPILITDADNFKDKEVSYYYGIPLSKRIAVADNNFSFRTLNDTKAYVIYYRGAYSGRIKAIQQLLAQAKKDTMRSGDLHQTFLEEPDNENNTVLKLSLPVFR